ncbi:AAA family ATPase [Deinococcus sp. QL22]|uniref:AAA family ATPase n=1 Tax=Deinococcus sp. QL22 TaxID=2939437 RepID=UPI002016AA20|nr:MoxR family ATPase [Deinococcus sp. QL22]UQN08852.1 MoxR family ATPase [Deinococcus sp. QL22]
MDHDGLKDLIVGMGTVQTIMIWGPPGVGKSQLIEQFAVDLGMHMSLLLGSQMSPEDLAVPLIDPASYTTKLCPPATLMRQEPGVVFIDELNGAEPDVMRAFFPVINERRIGEHHFPPGTVVVCAGNPTSHNSVARPIPAPLMNRMYHVQLKITSTRGWLDWAAGAGIHPLIHEFIAETGLKSLLGSRPGDDDQIATTPRSWEIASRAVYGWGSAAMKNEGTREHAHLLQRIISGAVAQKEAEEFGAWLSRRSQGISLTAILRGAEKLPDPNTDRALVAHLIALLRARLGSELPRLESDLRGEARTFVDQATYLMQQLSGIAPEMAASLLSDQKIPAWFFDRVMTRMSAVAN